MSKNIQNPLKEVTCGICGKVARQARLLGVESQMCNECAVLFDKAMSPIVSVTGYAHPAVGTYYHDPNYEAIKVWEEHMIKCGFVKKWGKWRKKNKVGV